MALDESVAAFRRERVKALLEALAAGRSGTRWDLSGWGPRDQTDHSFMLRVSRQLQRRGLVSVDADGMFHPVPGVAIDTSDDAVTAVCWPSRAPSFLDQQWAEETAALAREESAGEEEVAVEPEHDKLDVLLRVVGQLAENVVYMREKLDGQKTPDLDAVLDLLSSIETQGNLTAIDASKAVTAGRRVEEKLAAIEGKIPEFEDRKFADSLKVVNAVAVGANEQGAKVENALGVFGQRLGAIEQAVGALLKRPTAVPDSRIDEVLKKTHMLGNAVASVVNKQEVMTKDVQLVVAAADKMVKSIEHAWATWDESAKNTFEGIRSIGALLLAQAAAYSKFEGAIAGWARGIDKAIGMLVAVPENGVSDAAQK